MSTVCTKGKDGRLYYFRDGKRISAAEVKKPKPAKSCKLSAAAKEEKTAKAKAKKRAAKAKKRTPVKPQAAKPKKAKTLKPKAPKTRIPAKPKVAKPKKEKAAPMPRSPVKPKAVIPKAPKPVEELYLWDLELLLIPVNRHLLIPNHHIGYIRSDQLRDKAYIHSLYQKYGLQPNTLVYVNQKTHEALKEVEQERSSWDVARWDTFITFIYPSLSQEINILKGQM